MGTKDKASNQAQNLKGKVKEVAGDDKLRAKGKADQTKASLKGAGEKVKDAASNVKDAVTRK